MEQIYFKIAHEEDVRGFFAEIAPEDLRELKVGFGMVDPLGETLEDMTKCDRVWVCYIEGEACLLVSVYNRDSIAMLSSRKLRRHAKVFLRRIKEFIDAIMEVRGVTSFKCIVWEGHPTICRILEKRCGARVILAREGKIWYRIDYGEK